MNIKLQPKMVRSNTGRKHTLNCSNCKRLGFDCRTAIGSWYIIHKPPQNWKPKNNDPLIWNSEMDRFNGKIFQCQNYHENHYIFNGIEHAFNPPRNYAFHSDWLEGPFTTNEKAMQHIIKFKALHNNIKIKPRLSNQNWYPEDPTGKGKNDPPDELRSALKEIDKHYDKEINNLINDYHNRGKRRLQLNNQINNVFNKESVVKKSFFKKSFFKKLKPFATTLIWICFGGVAGYLVHANDVIQYLTTF